MNPQFNTAQMNPTIPDVSDVDPKEVSDKKSQVVLIDVRRPEEYTGELGHIAGSRLLTLDQLPAHIESLPKDKTIVFVCRSGARSAQAASFAIDNGICDVYNMKGGMLLWNEYGLAIEK